MFDLNDNIIAMIAAYINNPPLCYISHVSVLDEYKRNSLFSQMLTFLENVAKHDNCTFIKLEVKENNGIKRQCVYAETFMILNTKV